MSKVAEQAAINTRKAVDRKKKFGETYTTAKGIKIKLSPVATSIFTEAMAEIKDAIPPTYINEQTGKEELNPASPEYQKDLKRVEKERSEVSMNALILFGIELVDDVPKETKWLDLLIFSKRITEKEKKDALADETGIPLEFLYKKYVVADADVTRLLASLAGVTQEQIASAQKTFRDNEE